MTNGTSTTAHHRKYGSAALGLIGVVLQLCQQFIHSIHCVLQPHPCLLMIELNRGNLLISLEQAEHFIAMDERFSLYGRRSPRCFVKQWQSWSSKEKPIFMMIDKIPCLGDRRYTHIITACITKVIPISAKEVPRHGRRLLWLPHDDDDLITSWLECHQELLHYVHSFTTNINELCPFKE